MEDLAKNFTALLFISFAKLIFSSAKFTLVYAEQLIKNSGLILLIISSTNLKFLTSSLDLVKEYVYVV